VKRELRQVLFLCFVQSIESDDVLSQPRPIMNVFVVLMLFDWLPDIKQVTFSTFNIFSFVFFCYEMSLMAH